MVVGYLPKLIMRFENLYEKLKKKKAFYFCHNSQGNHLNAVAYMGNKSVRQTCFRRSTGSNAGKTIWVQLVQGEG